MGFALKDKVLKGSKTLPNGAATATLATFLDLEHGSRGDFLANCELLLSAPALNSTQLSDGKTMIYSILESDSSDGSNPTVLGAILTQTGAGGVGAAAATATYRPRVDSKRYVGFKAVGSTTGDATAATATLEIVF